MNSPRRPPPSSAWTRSKAFQSTLSSRLAIFALSARHAGERRGYFDAETLQGVAEMTGVVGDAILFRRQGREEGDPHQNALR